MKLNRQKVSIAMANKKLTVNQLASLYGVSRYRMYAILRSDSIRPATAGRVADALGVNATDIIEQ